MLSTVRLCHMKAFSASPRFLRVPCRVLGAVLLVAAGPQPAGGTPRPRMEPGVPASAPVGTETPTEARLCRLGREAVSSRRICVPKQSRTESLLNDCCAGLRISLRFCLKKRYNRQFRVTLPNSAEEQDKRNKGFYCRCFFQFFSCC